jgi:hypothetical protein
VNAMVNVQGDIADSGSDGDPTKQKGALRVI